MAESCGVPGEEETFHSFKPLSEKQVRSLCVLSPDMLTVKPHPAAWCQGFRDLVWGHWSWLPGNQQRAGWVWEVKDTLTSNIWQGEALWDPSGGTGGGCGSHKVPSGVGSAPAGPWAVGARRPYCERFGFGTTVIRHLKLMLLMGTLLFCGFIFIQFVILLWFYSCSRAISMRR